VKHIFLIIFCFFVFAATFVVTSQTSGTATTTSTQILSARQDRNYLVVINNGDEDVYLKIGSIHSGTEGILITAGGSWEPASVPIESIWIKASTGTQAYSIVEGRMP
jgi:hypothetical protein